VFTAGTGTLRRVLGLGVAARARAARRLACAQAALVLLGGRLANAQQQQDVPGASPAAADEAPRVVSPVAPTYPPGEEGDASVLLVVTVDREGRARDVRVLEGREPFASVAANAVGGARFAPATRGGEPIAATIRFRVDFTKPQPSEPPAAAIDAVDPEPDPDPPVAASGMAVEEVRVRGARSKPRSGATDTLARAEVRQLPGAFGDPFRAIEVAPGLTPVLTGLPYFYVRGAPPGNVGYYFDGVRVPYLFHFGLGPAVIQPALIARTDLHRGGYPAALGRWAGGVVDATSMAPAERAHGEAQLRLIDAGALVEAPFSNGRGAALASARYSTPPRCSRCSRRTPSSITATTRRGSRMRSRPETPSPS
jgi:hypothetical protein